MDADLDLVIDVVMVARVFLDDYGRIRPVNIFGCVQEHASDHDHVYD